jgi:rhodanese-related sulfurtransferase
MPDRILTGDTLFLDEGGAGRDDLPGGDAAIHWESLQRLKELHDNVVVYPGHDYRSRRPSTIGEQKQRNPFFKPRSQDDYIRFVDELKLGPADWMKEVLKANVHCTRERGALHIPSEVSACEALGTLTTTSASQAEPGQVSAHQLRQRLDAKEKLVLLDVRESTELSEELGHIAGIIHVPVGMVICKMGGRARSAAKILQSEGFPTVRMLSGGMIAWNNAGLPVQRSSTTIQFQPPPPSSVPN